MTFSRVTFTFILTFSTVTERSLTRGSMSAHAHTHARLSWRVRYSTNLRLQPACPFRVSQQRRYNRATGRKTTDANEHVRTDRSSAYVRLLVKWPLSFQAGSHILARRSYPSAINGSAPTARIFVKFDTGDFYENLFRNTSYMHGPLLPAT